MGQTVKYRRLGIWPGPLCGELVEIEVRNESGALLERIVGDESTRWIPPRADMVW